MFSSHNNIQLFTNGIFNLWEVLFTILLGFEIKIVMPFEELEVIVQQVTSFIRESFFRSERQESRDKAF